MTKKFIHQMEPWIDREEIVAVTTYLRSGGWLTEFKKTQEFEEEIAKYVGSTYASVVSNGTVALFAALAALGIGKGNEVLVPDATMIASANVVLLAGASPVLVDIDPHTLCIDLALAEKAITKRTKALIMVSLNGRSPNMDAVISFCKKHKLLLLEDAAQSLGSRWNGKHLGTYGKVGIFSFSAPKVITTGQGGALVTDDDAIIDRIRKIKDFGRPKSGVDKHEVLGYNFKFTDILAVIGLAQMKKLAYRVERKKKIFTLYKKELANVKQVEFIDTDETQTSPWFIDVLASNREGLIEFLKKKGIGTRPFYPPIHTQAPYNSWKEYKKKKFPVSEHLSRTCLWLPSSSFLEDDVIKAICRQIKKFYRLR